MRISPRAILLAAIAAVLVLMTLQPASAQPQATPIVEPESTETPESMSRSSLNQPLMTGDPIITYDHSDSIHTLPNAQYFFTIEWDTSDVDFGIIDSHVTLGFSLSYHGTDGDSSTSRWLGEHGDTGSVTFGNGQLRNQAMLRNCVHNEGRIKADLNFHAYNNQTIDSERLYTAEPYPVDIPCSADIIPVAPGEPAEVCGPNNDTISIPDQPNGVTVTDTDWVEGERTIEYDNADWAFFPDTFNPVFEFTDNPEEGCDSAGDPEIEFSHPESISGLPNAEYDFTFDYDFSDVDFGAPDDPVLGEISVYLQATNLNAEAYPQIDTSQPGQYTIDENALFNFDVAEACVAGEGVIVGEMRFSATNSNDESFTYSQSYPFEIPCTVGISPEAPILRTNVCGPANDIIEIVDQAGVVANDPGWQNNSRTISYSFESWSHPSDTAHTTFTFTDDQPCTATATFDYPDTLYQIDNDSWNNLTVNYDLSSVWPADDSMSVFIALSTGSTSYPELQLHIADEASSIPLVVTDATTAVLIQECKDANGLLPVSIEARFVHYFSAPEYDEVFTALETPTMPCSVAITPLQPTENPDVCGYVSERINVPLQEGITGSSISWEGNVATVTYTTAPAYEVVGGPYTVTVTAEPCIADEVPAPIQTEVCGPRNDLVDPGFTAENMPAGVFYDTSESWVDGTTFHIYISALPGWVLPDGQETHYEIVDKGDCIIEGLTAPVHTEVCGELNDTVDIPADQEHVTIASTGDMATDGSVTVTLTPDENYALPDGIEAEYVFTDEGDCIVTPVPPAAPVAVCGPNNDVLTIPDQPEGITVEDSGWVDNERTLEFIAAEGYAFPENTPRSFTATDESIACEEEPIGTTLVMQFNTSDGGSIEGTPYQLYAPEASQVSQAPYAEGTIGAGNQIVLEEIIAGTYRLVTTPEGYQPIDVTFEVIADEASEVQVIAVAVLQPVETPTPEPTAEPKVEPTIEATPSQVPTEQPTDPAQNSAPVTGLPETGTGSGSGIGTLALAGLLAAMILGLMSRRRPT